MSPSNKKAVELFLSIDRENNLNLKDEEQEFMEKLEFLDLNRTNIVSLNGLSQFPKLRSLSLSGSNVSSLKGLSKLSNLQELDLSRTTVSSFDELKGLPSLQKLNLAGTKVTSLDCVSELTNLRSLDLGGTHITDLESLRRLTKLQVLRLRKCKITSLEGLNKLTDLLKLDLSHTEICSLKEINELKKLRSIDLSYSKVVSLKELESLVNLDQANIAGISVDHIPKQFVDRGFSFKFDVCCGTETEKVVCMKDIQLSEQPVVLFSQSSEFIKKYYNEEQTPVNEAKVIFIGDGGVGKTYTISFIQNGTPPKDTKTTPGINVTSYSRKDQNKGTINYWDFGGQEILYSMHHFFMTKRTCYVVTVSNRFSEVTRRAKYWLSIVKGIAPGSKVILAVNHWEGVSDCDLDGERLKEEFPNLVHVVEYRATDSKDVEKLKSYITEVVDDLPSVNMSFPYSWKRIMEKLRNLADREGKYYITTNDYFNICKEEAGLEVEEICIWLLKWFTDIGVCFSYNEDDQTALANYNILNPVWLTNAVYIIINNGRQFAQQGFITWENIYEILKNPDICVVKNLCYLRKEVNFILEVLRKFRFSYALKNEDREFVPALCPNVMPKGLYLKEGDYVQHIGCKVKYEFLPNSVVHFLMIDFAERPTKCWLKGFYVDERDAYGSIAICDMGKEDNILYVDVYQVDDKKQSPQSFLRLLQNKREEIDRNLKLQSKVWLRTPDGIDDIELSNLHTFWNMGIKKFPLLSEDGSNKTYKVEELLRLYYPADSKIFPENQSNS